MCALRRNDRTNGDHYLALAAPKGPDHQHALNAEGPSADRLHGDVEVPDTRALLTRRTFPAARPRGEAMRADALWPRPQKLELPDL